MVKMVSGKLHHREFVRWDQSKWVMRKIEADNASLSVICVAYSSVVMHSQLLVDSSGKEQT